MLFIVHAPNVRKWLRLIEHLSPIYEWSLGGLQLGRTKEFILYGLLESWQYFKIRLFRRHITQTLMNSIRIVPIQCSRQCRLRLR